MIGGIIGGIFLVVLIAIIVLFNGNETTKLICTKKVKNESYGTSSTFHVTFKNNKIKLVESQNEIVVTADAYKKNMDVLYDQLLNQYGSAKNEKGVIVKPKKTSDTVGLTITVDALESPDSVSLVGSSITKDMSYDQVKKELDGRGYQCK